MKKILLIALAVSAVTIFGVSEAAMKQAGIHEPQEKPLLVEEDKGQGKTVSDEVEIMVEEEVEEGQEDLSQGKGNANQVSNKGEDNQIRTEEKEAGNEEAQQGPSEIALQRRSQVANQVHQLLDLSNRMGGIGEQVREIAQSQYVDIEKIEESVSNLQERSRFARFFIGPKTDKVEEAKSLLTENKERLETLKELKTEIKDAEDIEVYEKAVSDFESYITEIEEMVTKEEKGFSLFGWLFK
ncbi:MAG TPA: hypothetical protein PLG45_00835 [Candidatus Paceibacterota bacterium]|nr:hypothetical protein [Candidatus Paceibacterota bacterium]HPI66680.1 hypothetical protein [Candidatus Paceibacterota bacterium]